MSPGIPDAPVASSACTAGRYVASRLAQRVRERTVFWRPSALRNIASGWLVASHHPIPTVAPVTVFPELRAVMVSVSPLLEGSHPGDSGIEKIALVCAIAKMIHASRLLEVGTCGGFMSRHLVVNCGPQSRLWTLDLPEEMAGRTAFQLSGDERDLVRKSAGGRASAGWYAAESPERDQVIQILCDSATYSYDDLEGPLDFAYIDGAHNYAYVVADSINVLQRVRPGGIVVWDDYYHMYPGVIRAIGELHKVVPVVRLAGTGLVVTTLPSDWPRPHQLDALSKWGYSTMPGNRGDAL